MKRVEIKDLQFVELINGVKNNISETDNRPILKYIKLVVKRETITSYSCNGYAAARVTIKNVDTIDEEFECLIKPITVKPSKGVPKTVKIESVDGDTSVEVPTEYGRLTYCFSAPVDEYFVDIDKLFDNEKEHDREIGIQPALVINSLKALKGVSRFAVLETKENNLCPFIIRAESDGVKNEQLILPVRIQGLKGN